MEKERVEICNPARSQRGNGIAFRCLLRVKEVAADRIMVVLIPDEFQVNDKLWKTHTGNSA